MQRLSEEGGRIASSVADLVRQSDVVITMLPDSPDVETVVLGEDGVLAHAAAGLLLVDCSTIRAEASRAVADAAGRRGIETLDAPVSGGDQGAKAATLSIMVGGTASAFDRAQPILAAVGRTIMHVGPAGSGQIVKAANQLLVAGNLALVAEAIVLLQASGVDPAPALTALNGGLAGSRVLEQKGKAMLTGDFTPGFRTDLHHKDLGIVLAAARHANISLPVTGLVAQLIAAVRAQGLGSADHSAIYTITAALSQPSKDTG